MLPFAAFLHQRFAFALIAFAAVLGIWGTATLLRRRPVPGSLRGAFLLMLGLTAVQGLIGAALFAAGDRPREVLHVVYGIFAVLFLPGIYFYSARRKPETEALLLALACWIVAIAYGRGILTGSPLNP